VPGNILLTKDNTVIKSAGYIDTNPEPKVQPCPSPQNTIRDGIIIRWETDDKLLLRRPRTTSIYFI